MAIDGGMRKQLAAGMRLVATYKKQQHTTEVIEGEDGKLRFRLADGSDYSSPSAAGSAVMGGIACNGWKFWSLASEGTEEPKPAKQARTKAPRAKKAKSETDGSEGQEEPAVEPVESEETSSD